VSDAAATAHRRHARGLTLLQAQSGAGALTVIFAFAASAASGDFGWRLGGFFVAALLGSLIAGDRFAGKFAIAWTVLLAGALVVLGGQVITGQVDIVLGAARFVLLLTIHRLWNRGTERDELLLLLLSLLLVCAGAALSSELLFGFAFACFGIAATWSMALTHVRWQIEGARGPQDPAALLRSRRLITPALLGGLALLSLVGLASATVLFFVFPRVTIGGMRRPAGGAAVAGLGDSVDLSGHGTIADDPRVVLRVKLDPDPDLVHLDYHFRARAFEVWTGHGWRARENSRNPVNWLPHPPKALRKKGLWTTATIEAVSGGSDGLILTPPGWPVAVRFSRPMTARGNPYRLLRDGAGDLFYQPVEVGDLEYVVSLEPIVPTPKDGPELDPESLSDEEERDLEVPDDLDPRVRALAERLAKGKPAVQAAEAVRAYLETTFEYTRELAPGGKDPVAHFLFERRKGHCELFSSAMVMLLRAGGIPARNVTGYFGGVKTQAGYYAVRAGDAHSWVEAWMPGLGWMAFDPTPATERGSPKETLYSRAVLLWDGLASRWRSSVVDFDLLAQARAAQRALELLREAGRRLSGKGTGAAPSVSWRDAGLVVAAGLSIALVVLRRRRGGRRGPGRTQAALEADALRAQKLWREARLRLERAGLALPPSATPREVERAARERLPEAGPIVERLSRRCSEARWGGAPLPAGEARAMLSALRRVL
jgi:transglutaminase-like putative cysteine protease